jgi:hypothetical protein
MEHQLDAKGRQLVSFIALQSPQEGRKFDRFQRSSMLLWPGGSKRTSQVLRRVAPCATRCYCEPKNLARDLEQPLREFDRSALLDRSDHHEQLRRFDRV